MGTRQSISRRHFVHALGLSALSLGWHQAAQAERKPNFVLIVADDLGYGDLGCYGNAINQTPHLNRLAKEGMRFTDFHSNGPMCSPTRASLLTGRYQQRLGIEGPLGRTSKGLGYLDEITLAKRLRDAGYATGMFGKWHLGTKPKDNPLHHGFDEFRGHMHSATDYISHVDRWGGMDWKINHESINEEGYNTHLITDHAVRFIREHREEPFFLYIPHSAIHFPWMKPDDPAYREVGGDYSDLSKLGPHEDVSQVVKTMIEEVDQSVGRIMKALWDHGLDEDTLVFFTSDNGGYRHYAGRHRGEISDNGPLRGQKTDVFEGGHRVPAIARWPKRINPASVTHETAMTMDVMPTFLDILNETIPKPNTKHAVDGITLAPLLFEQNTLPKRTLFWRMDEKCAVRRGPWKLVRQGSGDPWLFHLGKDLGERNDRAAEHPELVRELQRAFKQWEKHVEPKERID